MIAQFVVMSSVGWLWPVGITPQQPSDLGDVPRKRQRRPDVGTGVALSVCGRTLAAMSALTSPTVRAAPVLHAVVGKTRSRSSTTTLASPHWPRHGGGNSPRRTIRLIVRTSTLRRLASSYRQARSKSQNGNATSTMSHAIPCSCSSKNCACHVVSTTAEIDRAVELLVKVIERVSATMVRQP